VTLFEANDFIGGQFDMARRIPGKEEFSKTIRYFTMMLDKYGVVVRLSTRACADELTGYDDVVLATGVAPRVPAIPGIDHPMVLTYAEAITGAKPVGRTVAVVGAGGIGFDVSELLVTDSSPTLLLKEWKAEWGAADPQQARGALTAPLPAPPAREVYLLQRSKGPQGKRLGKTSGWVHRASLKANGVHQLSGVNYERISDNGLHISSARIGGGHSCLRSTMWWSALARSRCAISRRNCEPTASTRTSSAARLWPPSWTPSAPSNRAPNWRPDCNCGSPFGRV